MQVKPAFQLLFQEPTRHLLAWNANERGMHALTRRNICIFTRKKIWIVDGCPLGKAHHCLHTACLNLGTVLTAALQERGEQSCVHLNFAVSSHTHPRAKDVLRRHNSLARRKRRAYVNAGFQDISTNKRQDQLLFAGTLRAARTPCLAPLRG